MSEVTCKASATVGEVGLTLELTCSIPAGAGFL